MTEKNISENARKAEEIKGKMSEDVRTATEAMQRTVRARRVGVFVPKEYKYQQIF